MDEAAPQTGDVIIDELRWNGFTDTQLDAVLRTLGARRLIIAEPRPTSASRRPPGQP
jgi:nicotinamidase-related amidase